MDAFRQSPHKNTSYIKGIDGLRALAVLAVMLFHLDSTFLPGGFSGVDIFFVISGYVVSASLFHRNTSSIFHFTANFYARRIIRIFPALIVCLVVVSILTTLFIPASWLSDANEKTGVFAFFGLGNYALTWFNDGYFSPRVDFNPFTHTWSLGVEEQFYVIFPLIFFVWIKYKNKSTYAHLLTQYLLTSLLILSLIYSGYETNLNPDKAFYLLPSRFWELACGAILFQLHARQIMLACSTYLAQFYLIAGIILISLGFVLSSKQGFPFPWAILSVSGTLFVIIGFSNGLNHKPIIQTILESSALTYIGKTSYSLYLWHWPIYVLLGWTSGLSSAFDMLIALLLTFIMANLSYHYIENPIRQNVIIRNRPNWQILIAGLIAIALFASLTNKIFNAQPQASLSVTKNQFLWHPYPWPASTKRPASPNFTAHKIYAVGDSHLGAYSTMLQKLSDELGVETVQYSTGNDCALATLRLPVSSSSLSCQNRIKTILANIEKSASVGDILFLASLKLTRLGDQWQTFNEIDILDYESSEAATNNRKLALHETVALISQFEKLPMHIIIDAPKPIFKVPPFRCSDWFNRSNPDCAAGLSIQRDFLLNYRRPIMDSLESLSAAIPNLVVWDPFPVLCKAEVCTPFDQNGPLFFDGDHLSAHGNRVLYPSFSTLIKQTWSSNR